MPEYQVYLKRAEARIAKRFYRVANPRSKWYGKHSRVEPISDEMVERAKAYFATWPGTTIGTTIFKDVLLLRTTSKELAKRRLPSWIETIDDDPHFHQALEIYQQAQQNTSVQILPKLPPVREDLKRRLNLECMLEGIFGRSLIASNDSIWAEMPAVTIVAETPKTIFSSTFSRKATAPYQHYYVNTYLWDPVIQTPLRGREFSRFGRASPDLTIKKIEEFASLISALNQKRVKQHQPPLGFLNYFLYQNPQAFRRKRIRDADYPNSPTFWSANIGLGRIDFDHLQKCANRLINPPLPLWKWAWVNLVSLFQTPNS